jgi:hypothetical protein
LGHRATWTVNRWVKTYNWTERTNAYDLHRLDELEEMRRERTIRFIAKREQIELDALAGLLDDYKSALGIAGDIMQDPEATPRAKLRASRQVFHLLEVRGLGALVQRAEDRAEQTEVTGLDVALSGLGEAKAALVIEYLREGVRNARASQDEAEEPE